MKREVFVVRLPVSRGAPSFNRPERSASARRTGQTPCSSGPTLNMWRRKVNTTIKFVHPYPRGRSGDRRPLHLPVNIYYASTLMSSVCQVIMAPARGARPGPASLRTRFGFNIEFCSCCCSQLPFRSHTARRASRAAFGWRSQWHRPKSRIGFGTAVSAAAP